MTMTEQPPLVTRRKAGIGILTFNRPHVHNALDTATVSSALDVVQELAHDAGVRVLVVTGAGKTFIAGADIAEMREKTPAQARDYSQLGHTLMRTLEQLDKPVIAAVNGYCLGGGMEVALASDLRIASEKARFGLPETILGIIPGWGALPRATRLLGPAVTKELVFTGEPIDAREALRIGLVNRVVPHEGLMDEVMDIANTICRQSRFALARAKEVIDASGDLTAANACAIETDAFVACFEAGDHAEGMQAFMEKREPRFGV